MTDPTDAIPDAELLDLLGPSWAAMSPRQRWEYGELESSRPPKGPTPAEWEAYRKAIESHLPYNGHKEAAALALQADALWDAVWRLAGVPDDSPKPAPEWNGQGPKRRDTWR